MSYIKSKSDLALNYRDFGGIVSGEKNFWLLVNSSYYSNIY